MCELDRLTGDPIVGGFPDGSGIDQDWTRQIEAFLWELPPVIGPPEGGADLDLDDTGAGDGWVPA